MNLLIAVGWSVLDAGQGGVDSFIVDAIVHNAKIRAHPVGSKVSAEVFGRNQNHVDLVGDQLDVAPGVGGGVSKRKLQVFQKLSAEKPKQELRRVFADYFLRTGSQVEMARHHNWQFVALCKPDADDCTPHVGLNVN